MDLYLGLLKQGFKRDEIIRHYNDHQQTSQASLSEEEDLRAPSTVDFAIRGRSSMVGHVSPPSADDAKQEQDHDASDGAEEDLSPQQVASLPADYPVRSESHAPRKSSQLRFGQNASPVGSDNPDTNPEFVRPIRTYRPRTDTYSYNQSEASETDLVFPDAAPNNGQSRMPVSASSSNMSPEAEDFVPGNRLQLMGTRRDFSPVYPQISPPASLLGSDDYQVASPPAGLKTSLSSDTSEAESEDPITLPAGPGACNSRSRSQSERPLTNVTFRTPKRRSNAQLDGAPVFNVYNDDAPSTTQPQTPADLLRHPLITEHGAAYTAPVGILNSPMRYACRYGQDDSNEYVPSPTAWSIMNQECRAREVERSVRLGANRSRRERIVGQASNDLSLDEEQRPPRSRQTTVSDGDDQVDDDDAQNTTDTAAWRDSLEDDGVGAENWELEEALTAEARSPRVMSGNARRFWP
jgi:hypothetical protein